MNTKTNTETNEEEINHSEHRVLTNQVATFKIIARNTLRMNLIAPRLTKKANIENSIKSREEAIKEYEKAIEVDTYELSKADTNHPLFNDTKKGYEDAIKASQEVIKEIKEEIKEKEEELEENEKGITKIETGETKVSAEELANLVTELTTQAALNQVSN
jgi:tetratricopeptide (TPR) repeat protein